MPMDVFVSSCVYDTCKLQLIQYSCVKIYYSILPYPVDQTTSSPPACLRSLPVLAAARMTHSSKHTIGETFDSINTLWAHRTNTGSIIPIASNHQDKEDLYRTQEIILIIAGLLVNLCIFLMIVYNTIKSCKKL